MLIRIGIAIFASFVTSFSYFSGLARLTTGLLLGLGLLGSMSFGVMFLLPAESEGVLFPAFVEVTPWPYFVVALLLALMIASLYLVKAKTVVEERVTVTHFKLLIGGIIGYLASLFLASVYLFPSAASLAADGPQILKTKIIVGGVLYLVGISISCYLLYRASKGGSETHPDLMRRTILGLFALLQLDKVPLLITYLLIYSPETVRIFPEIGGIALLSYLPVGLFLLQTTWETS